jgi:DNA gyrase subunit A
MKVYELPEGAKNSKGRAIQNLLNIESGDSVTAFISCKNLEDEEFVSTHNLVFATKAGVVKKTCLREYARVNIKGKKAIIIREDDRVIGVELTDGDSEIILANRNGRAIRFHESKVREMGRVSTGVRGMTLDDDGTDEVVGMICMEPGSDNSVMVVSERGFGKRSELDDYRITNRGGKGLSFLDSLFTATSARALPRLERISGLGEYRSIQLTPSSSILSTNSCICSGLLPSKPSQPMPISLTFRPVRPNLR